MCPAAKREDSHSFPADANREGHVVAVDMPRVASCRRLRGLISERRTSVPWRESPRNIEVPVFIELYGLRNLAARTFEICFGAFLGNLQDQMLAAPGSGGNKGTRRGLRASLKQG